MWDSVIYEQTANIKLPMNDASWRKLTAVSTSLQNKHKVNLAQAKDLDPAHWALDSYELSKSIVYRKVARNRKLDNIYI